jgi:hypothetical protein
VEQAQNQKPVYKSWWNVWMLTAVVIASFVAGAYGMKGIFLISVIIIILGIVAVNLIFISKRQGALRHGFNLLSYILFLAIGAYAGFFSGIIMTFVLIIVALMIVCFMFYLAVRKMKSN